MREGDYCDLDLYTPEILWEMTMSWPYDYSDYWGPEGSYKVSYCSLCGYTEYIHDDAVCSLKWGLDNL